MIDSGEALRRYRAGLTKQHEEREANDELAKKLRVAWAEGHNTLYKFKSLRGESRGHALDIIRNSRLRFSIPTEFNDPLDCNPVCRLAKSFSDPEFVQELIADEARAAADAGHTAEDLARMRESEGVPVERLGSAVTERIRKDLRADTRVCCFTTLQTHPLQWSHYADSHQGVCLHFSCRRGSVFGLARLVKYRKERLPILVPLKYNKPLDEIAERMVWTKADFWSYENECRIVSYVSLDSAPKLDKDSFCSFPPRLLCGITLGMCIKRTDREEILSLAADRFPKIPVYAATEDEDRFWMDVRRIA